jgi:hypothetical protein
MDLNLLTQRHSTGSRILPVVGCTVPVLMEHRAVGDFLNSGQRGTFIVTLRWQTMCAGMVVSLQIDPCKTAGQGFGVLRAVSGSVYSV